MNRTEPDFPITTTVSPVLTGERMGWAWLNGWGMSVVVSNTQAQEACSLFEFAFDSRPVDLL